MNCKLLIALCATFCTIGLLEAASLTLKNTDALVRELGFKKVNAHVRNAREAYTRDSSEDSGEDDEKDDAELQYQSAIRQSVDDSQEDSDEDDEDDEDMLAEDIQEYLARRLRRDVSEAVNSDEIKDSSKPTEGSVIKDQQPAKETNTTNTSSPNNSDFSNTSVLILIRDTIKKVTELPDTQQVATSAQQYFQLFEHFLQQTIEQVIGEDEDEDEITSITLVPEPENVTETHTSESTDQPLSVEINDKESSIENEVPKVEKNPDNFNEIKI